MTITEPGIDHPRPTTLYCIGLISLFYYLCVVLSGLGFSAFIWWSSDVHGAPDLTTVVRMELRKGRTDRSIGECPNSSLFCLDGALCFIAPFFFFMQTRAPWSRIISFPFSLLTPVNIPKATGAGF
ncbi:hypothetical protein P170DRAFT_452740 [Aspergillus steynii IBT 23096]|uniref:Uncharacterized protein n=1 Tax=Aspergillus steynii IBT 23096 TaxID=1392250 RepID=A0A2I2GQZ9_9EURO|nr:uncharacterized protein P170DRAFT_452740 [Aspergillus steynii IBT 23096]PLB55312.1 hypothetical protein P170DRAFT_452740 [Aspergillus steynii IBT 23096]